MGFGIWTTNRQGCIDLHFIFDMKKLFYFVLFFTSAAVVESLYLNDRLPTRVGRNISIFKRKDESKFVDLLRKMIAEFRAKNLDSDGLEILRTEDRDLYPSPKKICDFLAQISEKFGKPLGGHLGSSCGNNEVVTKSKPAKVPEISVEIKSAEEVSEPKPIVSPELIAETVSEETNPETISETNPETSLSEIIPETELEVITTTNQDTDTETNLEVTLEETLQTNPETKPEMNSETKTEPESELEREPKKLEATDENEELPPCPNILPRTDLSKSTDIESLGQLWYGQTTKNLMVPGVTCQVIKPSNAIIENESDLRYSYLIFH